MTTTVVFLGHVDHGKSTLIGRLLYDSDSLLEGRYDEILALVELYKRRFEFAYFLDALEDEVRDEMTVDTARVGFQGRRPYLLVDVPGHRELMTNMLSGAWDADMAVLVVSATDGPEAQTARHLYLAELLGIERLVVVVNKMDLVDYDEAAFRAAVAAVESLLHGTRYQGAAVIPISAHAGDNVVTATTAMAAWYQGPTFVELLDASEVTAEEGATRVMIQGRYDGVEPSVVFGQVLSGTLREGDELVFAPSGRHATVRALRVMGGTIPAAERGSAVALEVDVPLTRGEVGGPLAAPPRAVPSLVVECAVLGDTLSAGDEATLCIGTAQAPCTITRVDHLVDTATGDPIDRQPVVALRDEAARVELTTHPIVAEPASRSASLGHVLLTAEGNPLAVGIVVEAQPGALS